MDAPAENTYPMPLTATGIDDVEVGRIRQSLVFGAHGIDLFVCGDQLLRGAALNAVLIAERTVFDQEELGLYFINVSVFFALLYRSQK